MYLWSPAQKTFHMLQKMDIFKILETDILRMQGFRSVKNASLDVGLGEIKNALPHATFPVGAVHEFLTDKPEDVAATSGFIAGLLSSLAGNKGATLWISPSRLLFPPALKSFGMRPDHIIFIDVKKEKEVLWAMEEALKCHALSAVIGELRDLDFTASRRLQLAVEQSDVTGFIIRKNPRRVNATACVSRWKISSLPGEAEDFPGVGFPTWKVELLRIRNGKTGCWSIQWINGKFVPVYNSQAVTGISQKRAG